MNGTNQTANYTVASNIDYCTYWNTYIFKMFFDYNTATNGANGGTLDFNMFHSSPSAPGFQPHPPNLNTESAGLPRYEVYSGSLFGLYVEAKNIPDNSFADLRIEFKSNNPNSDHPPIPLWTCSRPARNVMTRSQTIIIHDVPLHRGLLGDIPVPEFIINPTSIDLSSPVPWWHIRKWDELSTQPDTYKLSGSLTLQDTNIPPLSFDPEIIIVKL